VKLTTHLQLVPRSRKYGSIYPHPHTPSWRNAQLVKHRDNFTFYINVYMRLRKKYRKLEDECYGPKGIKISYIIMGPGLLP
jgi:hypothetical protein